MTVASGSPVKIQVRVNTGGSAVGVLRRLKWSLPMISTAPEKGEEKTSEVFGGFFHELACFCIIHVGHMHIHELLKNV